MNKTASLVTILSRHITLHDGHLNSAEHQPSAWYIQLLLAICGWLAALFLLGFVSIALTVIIENKVVCILLGAASIAAVYMLFKSVKSEFTHHIGLAFSLAGQGLIMYGVSEFLEHSSAWFWLVIMGLELILVIVMPSFLHQLFSSSAAALCFYAALYEWKIASYATAIVAAMATYVWLREFNLTDHIRRNQGIGYGLVVALIGIKSTTTLGESQGLQIFMEAASPYIVWLDELLIQLVLVALCGCLLRRYRKDFTSRVSIISLVAIVALGAASFIAPGISIGVIVLLLGFSSSNRVLTILGGIALLLYISDYYYFLEVSLLAKSASLAATGMVLLLARWGLGYGYRSGWLVEGAVCSEK